MKNIVFLFFIITFQVKTAAQQNNVRAQGADEFGFDNPAGLSIEEMRFRGNIFTGYFRAQWLGGAASGYPRAQALSWLNNNPVHYLAGINMESQQIGETSFLGLTGRYAHSIGKNLKIGLAAGINTRHIRTENLDYYDNNDPVLAEITGTAYNLALGLGAFYCQYDINRSWNWFAGLSAQRTLALNVSGAENSNYLRAGAQGGFGREGWWLAGRLRAGEHQPGALDLLLRKYIDNDRFFAGCMATSDAKHQTAGLQAGYERALNPRARSVKPYLTFLCSLSKPLSSYIQGAGLIFDFRMVWSQQREKLSIPSF